MSQRLPNLSEILTYGSHFLVWDGETLLCLWLRYSKSDYLQVVAFKISKVWQKQNILYGHRPRGWCYSPWPVSATTPSTETQHALSVFGTPLWGHWSSILNLGLNRAFHSIFVLSDSSNPNLRRPSAAFRPANWCLVRESNKPSNVADCNRPASCSESDYTSAHRMVSPTAI